MRLSPYAVLPVLIMALALTAAIVFADAEAVARFAGETFPAMCGF